MSISRGGSNFRKTLMYICILTCDKHLPMKPSFIPTCGIKHFVKPQELLTIWGASKISLCVCPCELSLTWFFVTLWTIACQHPLSMGFFQQETLEWVATSLSRGSSWHRARTCVSWLELASAWQLQADFFYQLSHWGSPQNTF